MDQLLRLLIAFTVAYVVCVLIPREALAQTTVPGGRTIYALPTPAGVIPTEVLGPYAPLPQSPLPPTVTAGGIAASSSTTVPVAVAGRTVPVPVTATARIPFAAIGRAAAKLFPLVSTALAAKELFDLLVPLGYSLSNTGQLQSIQKPAIAGDAPGTGYGYQYLGRTAVLMTGTTPAEACSKLAALQRQELADAFPGRSQEYGVDASNGSCQTAWVQQVCNGPCLRQGIGYPLQKIQKYYTPQLAPASQDAIASDATSAITSDPERARRLYDALQRDWLANPALPADANPIDPSTPVEVTAPPVTTPEKVIRVETIQKPDGSTDTVTTKEKTTVTPATKGTTAGDVSTTYTYNTTTTTTTTNNVTNVTTTSTVTQNGEIAPPAQDKPVEDPCKANPGRAGCAELGTPPDTEAIPRTEVPFSFNPLTFASAASCPTPIQFYAYGARQISFQPLCDVMTQLRPIFLACASLATAMIFLRGIGRL